MQIRALTTWMVAAALTAAAAVSAAPRQSQPARTSQTAVQPTALADDLGLVPAFPSLSFTNPLYFTVAPGDTQHAFVVTQGGVIYIFDNSPTATTKKAFLDWTANTNPSGGELGMLGLAFDPDYANNGYFYVNYNPRGGTRRTYISRFKVSANDPTSADPASETVLLQYDQPYPNHNGGWLGFGADGKLYITAGDGGSAGDPNNNAQSLDTPLGKILRINADGSIPQDNPYVGVEGARGEIWAWGLRNPFRASFDRLTGELWAADVGQEEWEEVDLIVRGGNYGWSRYEGTHVYNDAVPEPENAIFPVTEYNHDDGRCSIQGGYVYRGTAVPALYGVYVYADYCSATVFGLSPDGNGGYVSEVIGTAPGNPTSFGEDHAGEVYMTAYDGHIYKFSTGGSTDVDPAATLSGTGLFTDTASLTPSAALIEYGINAPFWSDNAIKRRWFSLPEGGKIGFDRLAAWDFPEGSIIVKHFDMDLADGSRTRLETRLLVRQPSGWKGYSYQWREDQTDADLLEEGKTVEIETLDAAGEPMTQTYEYPSRGACLACHTSAAGYTLGLKTPQMNRRFTYTDGPREQTENQIAHYDALRLFDGRVSEPSHYAKLPSPANENGDLNRRARAYLDTNCSQCHRPSGPTPVNMDLRYGTAIADTQTLDVPVTEGELGIEGVLRIDPGSKENSMLWIRMQRLDAYRMPPIGSHRIDDAGVQLIGEWIDAGAGAPSR